MRQPYLDPPMQQRYLDLDELPPPSHTMTAWPWPLWKRIPPGKALPVPDSLRNGRPVRRILRTLNSNRQAKTLGLRFTLRRGEKLFVYRPRKEKEAGHGAGD